MGTEYCLYNHANATFYELGKGPWYFIEEMKWALHDAEIFAEVLKDEWDTFDDDEEKSEENIRYYKLIAKDLEKFVKNAKENQIVCHNDAGDHLMQARMLKYICVGSRYNLGDPKENQAMIDSENDRSTHWSFKDLSDEEIFELRKQGWNFSKALS